ncbi:beta-N-acetylhexosaminidase [Myxococcota bacterium]|nr:beta-N-acetylhexosaminidase [Myxococcota bacterium]
MSTSAAQSSRNSRFNELHEAAGQKLLVGFAGAHSTLPVSIERALQGGLGGVILFRRNVDDIHQFMDLTRSIRAVNTPQGPGPFVAADQEGGRVLRLRSPLSPIPAMRKLGEMDDLDLTAEISGLMARELEAVGVNLNFAPVVDVDSHPENPVIGDRSFSPDPTRVARHGLAFIEAHLRNGVLPCAKHFPGHGDTTSDSHLTLPSLPHDFDRLEAVELLPFRAVVSSELPAIMTAHILFEKLDPVHPASLSRPVLQDLLVTQLGFQGLIITDCLEMKAVSERYTIEEMIELGIEAGVDVFLISHSESVWQAAWEHLIRLGERHHRTRERILASAQRIVACKSRRRPSPQRGTPPLEVLGCREHQAIVASIGDTIGLSDSLDPTETEA